MKLQNQNNTYPPQVVQQPSVGISVANEMIPSSNNPIGLSTRSKGIGGAPKRGGINIDNEGSNDVSNFI